MNYTRSSELRSGAALAQVELDDIDRLQTQLSRLRSRLSSAESLAGLRELDPTDTVCLIREILRGRRGRDAHFGGDLFGEPAWDLLLELYAAEVMQRRVSVTSACLAGAVAPTTGLRWIKKLADDGWVGREGDPADGRRYWLFLTEKGSAAMRTYLSELGIRPIR